jgi:Bacterial transcriptional activator domain
LPDFRYDEFAQAEIARLDEKHPAAIEDRIDADLALGRNVDLVPELEKIVSSHPLRERPRGQLMLALYRSGRQAEALDVYTDTRRVLTEELGLEPSQELKKLQRAILEHEPGIATPSRIEVTRCSDRLRRPLGGARGNACCAGPRTRGPRSTSPDQRRARHRQEPARGRAHWTCKTACCKRARRPLLGSPRCSCVLAWVQSLRTYIRDSAPDALDEQLGAGASDLAQLFPELRELYPDPHDALRARTGTGDTTHLAQRPR